MTIFYFFDDFFTIIELFLTTFDYFRHIFGIITGKKFKLSIWGIYKKSKNWQTQV